MLGKNRASPASPVGIHLAKKENFLVVIQLTPITCTTVDRERSTGYGYSMNNTIRPEFLSPDDFSCIWTDDEDLSDCDPVADLATFTAFLYADEEDDTYNFHPIRWIDSTNTARRVTR